MTRKQGSNQYKSKYRVNKVKGWLFLTFLLLSLAFAATEQFRDDRIIKSVISVEFSKPIVQAMEVTNLKVVMVTHTPTPTPTPSELETIISYITRKFEPQGKQVVKEALLVAFCESKWSKDAYNYNTNGTGDFNIFQINEIHIAKRGNKWMHDWQANVDTAYQIYSEQGWRPWVCARKLGIVE